MKSPRVKIIGIGEAGVASLAAKQQEAIETAHTLIGGERLLSMFPGFEGNKVILKKNIAALPGEIASLLESQNGHVAVLASGDPLFFGIGSLLARKLPQSEVEIFPALSSLQLAFAKAGLSWNDAAMISLHGRPITGLAQKINGRSKVLILTDSQNHPGAIARYLNEFQINEYRIYIGEDLGSKQERFSLYGPGSEKSQNDLAAKEASDFHELNVMILERDSQAPAPAWPLGINDEEFAAPKPERGLITKKEIRVQILSALEIFHPGATSKTFWDVGACTGSVSIEAARLAPELQIFALEKNPQRLGFCRQNMIKFRTDFTLLNENAPEGLHNLPEPAAIFIGGSGGNLPEILNLCCEKLLPGGVIVSAAATLETLDTASRGMREIGYEIEITQHWISRSKPIGKLHRLEAQNPVFLIKGKKPQGKNS